VDAGMRELNATGLMHNRVRMVVASFLAKHLLIGWQWAAGSGCDAAPYFRVFNPALQAKKFNPDGSYIRKWVPEWEELTYPPPMVEHEVARKRALEA